MDAAGHGLSGVVVDDGNIHPISAGVGQLEAHLLGLYRALALDVAPTGAADLLARLLHGDGCGGCRGDLDVSRAGFPVGRLAPALERVADEPVARLPWEGERVGVLAPVYLDVKVEWTSSPLGVLEDELHRAPAGPNQRVLVHTAECDAHDQEARSLRYDLDGVDALLAAGVLPCPEVVVLRESRLRLELTAPHGVPRPGSAGHRLRAMVGHGEIRHSGPAAKPSSARQAGYLESLPDCGALDTAVRKVENVLCDIHSQRPALCKLRLQEAVGKDDAQRGAADRDSDGRVSALQVYEAGAVRLAIILPDEKGQAQEALPAQGGRFLFQHAGPGVAPTRDVHRIVVLHTGYLRLSRRRAHIRHDTTVSLVASQLVGVPSLYSL